MKVLVYFQPKNAAKENFEGNRLALTLSGALETLHIKHTSKLVDDYDVAHFIAPDDENKVNVAIEKGVPVIVSAMYCEDDPYASFVEYKSKDGIRSFSLKPKASKLLSKATLVLVPTQEAADFLKNNGVQTPIKVIMPGVDMNRFDFSRDDEKDLFYRYFTEDRNKKLVVALGEYTNNMDGINAFLVAGKKNPNVAFYYFGDMPRHLPHHLKHIIKTAPKNVHFSSLVPDDIYRSALLNADIFMFPGYHNIGLMSAIEAMAARCQLVVRHTENLTSDLFRNEENAYLAEFSETLTSLATDCLEGKIPSTIEKAYEEMKDNNYPSFAKKLKSIYQEEINKKKA